MKNLVGRDKSTFASAHNLCRVQYVKWLQQAQLFQGGMLKARLQSVLLIRFTTWKQLYTQVIFL